MKFAVLTLVLGILSACATAPQRTFEPQHPTSYVEQMRLAHAPLRACIRCHAFGHYRPPQPDSKEF